MELTPITEALAKSPVEKYKALWKDAIEKDWYFEGWKQKVLIVFCFLTTIATLLYWGWRILI